MQVIYTCGPDPLLLERFNSLDVTFQLTTPPLGGELTVASQTSPVAANTACAARFETAALATEIECRTAYRTVMYVSAVSA